MRDLNAWLRYISTQHDQVIDMGLARMQHMVTQLELQKPAAQIITVAGTNGKGSTCIACEALLLGHGLRVGVTLSPHLFEFNERIRIDGLPATDDAICAAFATVEAVRDGTALTYFEYAALAALWCFKVANVDVVVLEIGLGGRLDAFNIIAADIAVVTSIGLDHQAYLGETLELIGAEKAGVLRPDQHVALGANMPRSVLARAADLDLRPECMGRDAWVDIDTEKQSWSLVYQGQVLLDGLPMTACAPHNAALAFLALHKLLDMNLDRVAEAFSSATLAGRLQQSVHDERCWILDVAHNPAAAAFLVERLRQLHLQPVIIVCAMLADKDHVAVFNTVKDAFDVPWLVLDSAGARSLNGVDLAKKLNDVSHVTVSTWSELEHQVNTVTQPGDVILALGSFSVIEQVIEQIGI